MTKRWEAAIAGEIYVDHVFSGLHRWPAPGEEIFTRDYLREVGGGAAITACGLARLGRKTTVFSVIGEAEAAWTEKKMRSFGVETAGLKRAIGVRSGVTVSISVEEERTFYSYAGSNELLGDYLVSPQVLEQLKDAEHVHFSTALDRSVARYLLPELKSAGCTVSLDSGWQPEWYMLPESLETCRKVDYFLPNSKEAKFLTGSRNLKEAPRRLEELGFSHVVVKMGAKGAAFRNKGRTIEVPSLPVPVVDTTGAGDAFDAGLIDALLDGADLHEMVRRGCACGALSTRSAGALSGLAGREELEDIFCES